MMTDREMRDEDVRMANEDAARAADAFQRAADEAALDHERHAAAGENRWFVCPLCDDEQDEDDVTEVMSWDVYRVAA